MKKTVCFIGTLLFLFAVFLKPIFAFVPSHEAREKIGYFVLEVSPFSGYSWWKEYDDNGSKMLTEKGFKEGVSLGLYFPNDKFTPYIHGKFYQARMDSNGQTMRGTSFDSRTDLFGYDVEVGFQYVIWRSNSFAVIPFVSSNYFNRNRYVYSNSNPVIVGYTEKWEMLWGKVGLTLIDSSEYLNEGNFEITGYIGTDFFTKNRKDLSTEATKPNGNFFWGAGFSYVMPIKGQVFNKIAISAIYEYKRWKKSSVEDALLNGTADKLWQPETKEQSVTVNFAFYF